MMYWSPVIWLLHMLACPDAALSFWEDMNNNMATFLNAGIGEYVVFNCHIDFPHDTVVPYSLRWQKENKTVFSWYEGSFTAEDSVYAGRVSLVPADQLYGRASVNLTSIRESDSGWYECTVFFPNRKPNRRPNGTWFHLAVEGGTLLAIPPINVTVLEGAGAHFSCVTKDPYAEVTWYRDGVKMSELRDLSARTIYEPDGSMLIKRTDMADTGEFHCVVSNTKGDRQTAGAFLNVQYPAKVVYSPHEIYLPYGRPGMLDCHFRANPALTNLRWEKDGFLFDPYNVPGVFYKRNGSLFFTKVDESHSGDYTCTPYNDLGTEGTSPSMNVVVQRPPVFTVTPHSLYLRKIGDTLEMPCDALDGDSTHRPTIVWFRKDGVPLPSNRTRLHNGNLTLEHVVTEDRGMYQCVASNEAATISSDTELVIENVSPRAPYNLSATSTRNSVRLQWIVGFDRPNVEYSIWYRAVESAEWRTTRMLARGSTEVTLRDLSPGRTYEIMILGQDDRGDGMFSKAIKVKMQGQDEVGEEAVHLNSPLNSEQQIGPPRHIVVNLTRDGFVVHWEPPVVGADALRAYRVQWSLGDQEPALGSAETTETWWMVTPVEPGSTYHIQVSAIASVAHNDYISTGETQLLHIPDDSHVKAISVGIAAGVACLLVIAAGAIYLKRLRTRQTKNVNTL